MGYITVSEAARKWGISDRRVRLLCSQDRIDGVIHKGRKYLIPVDAQKPIDERTRKSKACPSPVVNVFEKSDAMKEELLNLSLSKAEADQLYSQFVQEFCYNSNAIDGNSLSAKDVISVLDGNAISRKPLKDHLDVVGTKDAFVYVKELADQKIPLSETIIKNIHSLVLIANASAKGRYRSRSLSVKDPYVEPVQPYMLKSRMNDLIFENNRRRKKMPALERIARFHMELKAIHPFEDGNGRTNRLIMNLELMQEGYPPIDIRFTDRKKYFEAFDSYFRDDDPDPMIHILVKYVEEAMEKRLALFSQLPHKDTSVSAQQLPEGLYLGSMMQNNPVRFDELTK